MHADQRVDSRDLENAGDAGVVRDHELQAAAALLHQPRRRGEDANARRVEERARGEVDDDPRRPEAAGQRVLEHGRGREIQLPGDVDDDDPVGHGLDPCVKIAGRGHDDRV